MQRGRLCAGKSDGIKSKLEGLELAAESSVSPHYKAVVSVSEG